MKISACVITKNEENNIVKCVESLKILVDEIVVVDTGSTDSTVDILKKLNVKLFNYNWNNNFSDARNYALSKACGDWIIFLDADEYIETDKDKLISTLANMETNFIKLGFIKLINLDNNKIIGVSNIIRVFMNQNDIKYEGKIHECISYNGDAYKIAEDAIKIYHTGYNNEIIEKKLKRNLDILIQELKENTSPKVFYYLSDCYFGLKNYKLAIYYGEKFIKSGYKALGRNIAPYKNKIASMINLCYYYKDIIKYINTALEIFPYHPELYRYLGNVYFDNKDYVNSLKFYEKTIELNSIYDNIEENLTCSYLGEIYYRMGLIYSLKGDMLQALDYYYLSVKEDKYKINSFIKLMNIIRFEKDEEIIAFLCKLYDFKSSSDVEFLIENISKLRLYKPLIYIYNLWDNSDKNKDVTYIFINLLAGNYSEVVDILLEISNSSRNNVFTKVLFLAALLSSELEIYNKVKRSDMNITYRKILDSLLVDENIIFYDSDINCYIDILQELIFIDSNLVKAYVKLTKAFHNTNIIDEQVGDCFFSNNMYTEALEFYKNCIDDNYNIEITSNKVAKVYYYLNDFNESLKYMKKTMEMGLFTKDNISYLQWISEKGYDVEAVEQVKKTFLSHPMRLNLGCGKSIKNGWINIDIAYTHGIDLIADLNKCKTMKLPFEENSIDEFYASHVIEHIENILPLMNELYRIAKPNAKAVFRCPYGSSDDAYEDPTHLRRYFLNSFGYFSQPYYWRADYGYEGDWQPVKIILYVSKEKYSNLTEEEILNDINTKRNVVIEMNVELIAIKPKRKPIKELQQGFKIEINYV